MSNNNLFKFGGTLGYFKSINADDINGKKVEIWGEYAIDSIRIVDQSRNIIQQYGGNGGNHLTELTWPSDGIIQLNELCGINCNGSNVISYIEFSADNHMISAGNANSPFKIDCNLMLKLIGVNCGQLVDSLTFEVVG